MTLFYAHLEVRFHAQSLMQAQLYAAAIVQRLERGFVLPGIDVEDTEVFTVDPVEQ